MSSSLPLKFAFLFSLSIAGAASFSTTAAAPFPFPRKLGTKSTHSLSPSTRPKATVSDLLALLGPRRQAESVNSEVARELRSCFKFLVPYDQTLPTRRSLSSKMSLPSTRRGKEIDDLILSPPAPVLELVRLAVDSGADPGAIHRALDPTIIPVPDVEGSNEDRCELTRTPYGRRFIDEECIRKMEPDIEGNCNFSYYTAKHHEGLNSYLEFLFEVIVERGPSVGLNVSLSRFDLFHGHLFLAKESGRLGILFHAREYPAYDKEVFPCNMGYCQVGSNVAYDDSMNLRNILWLAPFPSNSTKGWLAPGVLVVLDACPEGIIYHDLIPEYVNFARTLYEDDFGEVVVDVNYLDVGADVPKFQIFLC